MRDSEQSNLYPLDSQEWFQSISVVHTQPTQQGRSKHQHPYAHTRRNLIVRRHRRCGWWYACSSPRMPHLHSRAHTTHTSHSTRPGLLVLVASAVLKTEQQTQRRLSLQHRRADRLLPCRKLPMPVSCCCGALPPQPLALSRRRVRHCARR